MIADFFALADDLTARARGDEVLLLGFSGESTDFVRFNRSRVRQPGHVTQRHLTLDLVRGRRHAPGTIALTGDGAQDRARAAAQLACLRDRLPALPEDPHLLYATEPRSTSQEGADRLPDAADLADRVLTAGAGRDLVGLLARGGVFRGFANSLGQRNGFSSFSYNLDWSFYLRADKAVKCAYAGTQWRDAELAIRVDAAVAQLAALDREPKRIPPGRYRVFLAPVALADLVGMLGWGGFGLKALRTKQSSLLRMHTDGARLHPGVTLRESTHLGVGPAFQGAGFLKPDAVTLIERGAPGESLASPRSAREYGVEANGANDDEAPEALDLAAGDIPRDAVLQRLGTGVLVNNVHYLNYSDRPACRITGMTRFACFWVEGGQIQAPLEVMRFDETLYRALGDNLLGLTAEREMILESRTYGGRDTSSARVPGALVDDFHFNL